MTELPKSYEPRSVEKKWYEFWLDKNLFHADENSTKPKFSVVIPPPNVTGVLHMGHALNNTLQDVLARYKRMQGFNTLWVPGTDHAGIATQIVVERMLAKEGVKRTQLGREKFVEKVWEWKEKSGGMILDQQKRLGISVDWSRHRFTFDEGLSKAVRKIFVDLYNEKLIYRGNRLVNWCPRCITAVSDLEVKHADSKGSLWHIKYPLSDKSGELVVATTRPETLLGDTAVAVNPNDARYKKLVGKTVSLPLVNKTIPIVADAMVDKDFGSGVVKITPGHDFNDYETGQRHNLPMVSIFDDKGALNENAGAAYKGLKNPEARKKILEALTDSGLLVKEEPHVSSIGRCDRCDNVIEPMLSDQWFVKIAPLAKPAIEVVENKTVKFVPEVWTKNYLEWMYNIKDWCISRQLWWGHRIPAFYCDKSHVTVSMTDPTHCETCKSTNLTQDPDVLDTWFSSQLWPFSTMGWPENTKDLQKFYPTDVLVTGFDIIFFWVCRMIMAGLHFTKKPPFHTVYIHALVRDERGQKMSKSKGNIVDPLDLIADYGADSLRFTLASLVGAGRDIRFSEDRLEGYRNFVNKIWNATRFSLTALANIKFKTDCKALELTLSDQYIVHELSETISETRKALDEYRFTDAATILYRFTWNEFCDWYLELSKSILYGNDENQKAISGFVLIQTLERIVRLLHPFVPFVTEEIYQLLPNHGLSIMTQPYPETNDAFLKLGSQKASDKIATIKGVVTSIRNIRGENKINPGVKFKVRLATSDQDLMETLKENLAFVLSLAKIESVDFETKLNDTKKCAVSLVTLGEKRIHVIVPLEGLVDFQNEIARLEKELQKVLKDLELTEKKLSTETFMKNAPKEIIAVEEERKHQLTDKKLQISDSLKRLQ